MMDISEIQISDVIKRGICLDVSHLKANENVTLDIIPASLNLENKAVLFYFGWDRYWGTEQYYSYPFISEELVDELINKKVSIVGVDTINIDDSTNPIRPAHSKLLKNRIFIIENLRNLASLANHEFTLFAVPIKIKKCAAIPVRVFADVSM